MVAKIKRVGDRTVSNEVRTKATLARPQGHVLSQVLIESKRVSNSPSINFTTGIDGTYDNYMLLLSGIIPATDDTELWLRVSDDGGATWEADAADYSYEFDLRSTGGTNNQASATDTKIPMVPVGATGGLGGAAGESSNWEIRFSNPASKSLTKLFGFEGQYVDGGGRVNRVWGSGRSNATTAINGVQLLMASGNITGNVSLYGFIK